MNAGRCGCGFDAGVDIGQELITEFDVAAADRLLLGPLAQGSWSAVPFAA